MSDPRTSNQAQKADAFLQMHVRGNPLVLVNVWDAGSAKAVASGGAAAIATGSWSVAAANGFADGEHIPLDLVIGNLERIVAAVQVPVSIDMESGYGTTPGEVGASLRRAIEAGAIGCNLEDSFPENGSLRDTAAQVARIRAVRRVADELHVPFFINARTDVFFQPQDAHDDAAVARAADRARAYAEAGANGLFAPGLVDERLIARLVELSPLPLNIMDTGKTPPWGNLAKAGVARISQGPAPYLRAMKAVEELMQAARERIG